MCLPDADDVLRVVLLCAGERDEVLSALLDELRSRDMDFDLIEGVDLDSSRAIEAMHRHVDDALYVICRD